MKTQRIMPLLIVAAGLLVYHNIYRNPFLFDDHWSILDNLLIRHLWPTGEILTHSSRPVVELSLALNYAIGGLKPAGYHLLNVLIHIAAGLTLYGVVRRTVAPGPAGAVALIWVVHPLQTESVSYTIQRAESLMSLFYLLTLYCVIRGAGSRWWHLGAVASCAAGMATKEVMVTAPVVVLLYDRVFLARSWREVVRQRWGLYAGLAATWLLLPVLMTRVPADVPGWQPTAGFAYKGTAPREYALTQPGVVGHYLPRCLAASAHSGLRLGIRLAGRADIGGSVAGIGCVACVTGADRLGAVEETEAGFCLRILLPYPLANVHLRTDCRSGRGTPDVSATRGCDHDCGHGL